jgi:hypothetical protein
MQTTQSGAIYDRKMSFDQSRESAFIVLLDVLPE